MEARLEQRLENADMVRRSIGFPKDHEDTMERIMTSRALVSAEPTAYRDLFGQPMPDHLVRVIGAEGEAWVRLHDILGMATLSPEAERDARITLRLIDRLIELATDILATPTPADFLQRLEDLRRRSR